MADPDEYAGRIPCTPVLSVDTEIGILKREVRQLQTDIAVVGPCLKHFREVQTIMQKEMVRWRTEKTARDADMLELKAEMLTLKEENQTLQEELQYLKDERAMKKAKKRARKDKGAD